MCSKEYDETALDVHVSEKIYRRLSVFFSEKWSWFDVYNYIPYICLVYVVLVSKEVYTYTYARLSLHCSTFWVVGVVWHEPLFFLA